MPVNTYPTWTQELFTPTKTNSIQNDKFKIEFYQGNSSNGPLAQYSVYVNDNGNWIEVKNRTDYAGIYNKPIDGLMLKTDTGKTIRYAVRLKKTKKWLPWVTGYDTKDANNGYAGILGQEIDAIKMYLD